MGFLQLAEYENLRELQNLTDQGAEIVDRLGKVWTKNERNWWNSQDGEEVLGSHFFNYGISVYHISALKLHFQEQKWKGV